MCLVFYRSVSYGFIVTAGKSYSFIDGKLLDLEQETYVTVSNLNEYNGYVSIRCLTDKIQFSLSGGNEGKIDIAKYETKDIQRSAGDYVLTISYMSQDYRYLVSSGYSYFVYVYQVFRTRNNELLKEYKDAIPNNTTQNNTNMYFHIFSFFYLKILISFCKFKFV